MIMQSGLLKCEWRCLGLSSAWTITRSRCKPPVAYVCCANVANVANTWHSLENTSAMSSCPAKSAMSATQHLTKRRMSIELGREPIGKSKADPPQGYVVHLCKALFGLGIVRHITAGSAVRQSLLFKHQTPDVTKKYKVQLLACQLQQSTGDGMAVKVGCVHSSTTALRHCFEILRTLSQYAQERLAVTLPLLRNCAARTALWWRIAARTGSASAGQTKVLSPEKRTLERSGGILRSVSSSYRAKSDAAARAHCMMTAVGQQAAKDYVSTCRWVSLHGIFVFLPRTHKLGCQAVPLGPTPARACAKFSQAMRRGRLPP